MNRLSAFPAKLASGVLVLISLLTIGSVIEKKMTAQANQQKPPAEEKKLMLGEKEAKRLLLLMDKDKSGKVSKQEFLSFMEAEFDLLDVNHDGELDVNELSKSQVIRGHSR